MRNGDRSRVAGDRGIYRRGCAHLMQGDRWQQDRWYNMPTGSCGCLGSPVEPPPDTVTGYSLSGPASGNVGAASTPFTVDLLPVGGTITGAVTVTPSDLVAGGTFTPAMVDLTIAAPSAMFTYTPSIAGARTVSCANNKGLTNPANLIYDATSLPTGPILSDSWPESNLDSTTNSTLNVNSPSVGQTFTSTGGKLSSVKFYLKKISLPTGIITVKLYLATGSIGIDAIPVGGALAVSSVPLDIAGISTTGVLYEFFFTGANQYAMAAGTGYALAMEHTITETAANKVGIGTSSQLPANGHPGNFVVNAFGSWSADDFNDVIFYLYTT